jgi:hypothetical protein
MTLLAWDLTLPIHSVIAAWRIGPLRWVLPCLLLGLLGLRPGPVGAQGLPPQGQLTDLAGTLEREGTYVASRARPQVPLQAEERLQQLITDAEFLNVTLRFAVLDQAPRGYADLNEFTMALANAIRLRNGVLVVATPQQVTAISDQVPPEEAAALVTSAQSVLERDGLPASLETAAAGFVARAAQTVVPEARPTAGPVTTTTRVAERGANGPPFWPFLPGLALLGAGAGLYGWTTRRRWHELLGALEGAEVAASDLATTGRAAPATRENAQRRLEIGQRALATLRAIPWWQTWLWPWLPPPQLALAERAFSESLRLLGDPTAAAAVAPPSTRDAAPAPGDFAAAPARPSSSPADTPAARPSTPAAPPRMHDADGTANWPAADAAPGAPATSAPNLGVPSSPLAPVPPTNTGPATE